MASPLFDLSGKIAVVTGSSKGIGKSIALHLALQGAKVVVSIAQEAGLRRGGRRDPQGGRRGDRHPLQHLGQGAVREPDRRDQKAARAGRRAGLNAATNPYYGPTDKMPDEAFTKIMQNNILCNIWLINLCPPDMRAKKDGSIIIVSSIGGVRASTVIGAYCISKAADMQLARNLAAELRPDNIRVNTIAPGLMKTDFARALWENPEYLDKRLEGRRCGGSANPTTSAASPFMLAGKAGAFITGQTLIADAGVTIGG